MPILAICIYDKNKVQRYRRDNTDALGKSAAEYIGTHVTSKLTKEHFDHPQILQVKKDPVHYFLRSTNETYYCIAVTSDENTADVINYFKQIETVNETAITKLIIKNNSDSKIARLKKDVDDTKDSVNLLIAQMEERGGQLDVLVTRTDHLARDNVTFSMRKNVPTPKKKSSFIFLKLFICGSKNEDKDDTELLERDSSSKPHRKQS